VLDFVGFGFCWIWILLELDFVGFGFVGFGFCWIGFWIWILLEFVGFGFCWNLLDFVGICNSTRSRPCFSYLCNLPYFSLTMVISIILIFPNLHNPQWHNTSQQHPIITSHHHIITSPHHHITTSSHHHIPPHTTSPQILLDICEIQWSKLRVSIGSFFVHTQFLTCLGQYFFLSLSKL
jgi:hypothetical protein